MCSNVSKFCKNENKMNEELFKLYYWKKTFEEYDCSDISKLFWKMDLNQISTTF